MARLGLAALLCLILVSTNALNDKAQDQDEMQLADFQEQEAEVWGECETEVKMAQNKCAKRQSQLQEIVGSDCGDANLRSIMGTIHSNHVKTEQQQNLLHQAEQHLMSLSSMTSTTYSVVHTTETRVVSAMSKLETSQSMYSSEEHRAMSLSKEEKDLFDQAQAATQSAVSHAKSSEDEATTTGMRDKAADLFERYVHKRVLMATLQRQEKLSKESIATLTVTVQKEKEAAEKALQEKQKADEAIAAAKLQVKTLESSVANSELETSQSELKASEEELKMLETKVSTTHTVIQHSTSSLEESKMKATKAEHLAETATKLVAQTEDMSLKALMAQSEDFSFDAPWK